MQSTTKHPWPTAEEFAEKLNELGWRAIGDAQHTHITAYWNALSNMFHGNDEKAADEIREANRVLLTEHDPLEPKPHHCHKCGLPKVNNPHPDAGIPSKYLEVGCPTECLPCTVLSRHTWYQRAASAEAKLRVLKVDPATSLEALQDAAEAAEAQAAQAKPKAQSTEKTGAKSPFELFESLTKSVTEGVSKITEHLSSSGIPGKRESVDTVTQVIQKMMKDLGALYSQFKPANTSATSQSEQQRRIAEIVNEVETYATLFMNLGDVTSEELSANPEAYNPRPTLERILMLLSKYVTVSDADEVKAAQPVLPQSRTLRIEHQALMFFPSSLSHGSTDYDDAAYRGYTLAPLWDNPTEHDKKQWSWGFSMRGKYGKLVWPDGEKFEIPNQAQ